MFLPHKASVESKTAINLAYLGDVSYKELLALWSTGSPGFLLDEAIPRGVVHTSLSQINE